jgi:insertion element IS1 protein InsB
MIQRVEDAEVDAMGSYVGKQREPRWLWHTSDHRSGHVLAYVLGRRKDEVLLKRKALWEPFGITRCDTDSGGAYTRHLDAEEHQAGKRTTQQIERQHLTLRTRIQRLVRKTMCCSRSTQLHDLVIGWFVNRDEFGLSVWNRKVQICNMTGVVSQPILGGLHHEYRLAKVA